MSDLPNLPSPKRTIYGPDRTVEGHYFDAAQMREIRDLAYAVGLTERDALKAALRKYAVAALSKPDGFRCYQCGRRWGDDETERHVPDCLAAP